MLACETERRRSSRMRPGCIITCENVQCSVSGAIEDMDSVRSLTNCTTATGDVDEEQLLTIEDRFESAEDCTCKVWRAKQAQKT